MCKKKQKKCKGIKCATCENYEKERDFCKAKEIEEVSKQVATDFSQCQEYLVKEKLVMF